MINFTLPSLGADMDKGKLVQWRIAPGDMVKRGQIVAVIETSKAAVEVEIWNDGVVEALLVAPGTTVPVGTTLATLRAIGETASAPAPVATQVAAHAVNQEAVKAVEPAAAGLPQIPGKPSDRRRISPAARRHAEMAGIAIDAIVGTGPENAVTLQDVEQAIARQHTTPEPAAKLAVSDHSAPSSDAFADKNAEMRKAIAAAMSRSKREIPHYYLSEPVPMKNAQRWLLTANEKRPITERILMAALQLKAVGVALKTFPDMNGFYVNDAFRPASGIHIGVAISLRQGGLIAPAIHDVADKSLDQIMRDLMDLVKRTRAGALRSSELMDPSITITNLGDQGVESVYGVIYPPQVALVGFGRISERPWAENGGLFATPMMTASLAADHRVSDGHRGGLFLAAIRDALQKPEAL